MSEVVDTHRVKRFVVGDKADGREAWYGVGTNLVTKLGHSPSSVEEALKASGLDWSVSMEPEYQMLRDGTYREVPGRFHTVRSTDELVLGTGFTKQYAPFQNDESFDFVNNLLESNAAELLTAGMLGSKVFIQAKVTGDNSGVSFDGSDEQIDWYLLFMNSFDGSKAITGLITPKRLWCMNQVGMALKAAASKVSIRHTKNAKEKVEQAQEVLGLVSNYKAEFEAAVAQLQASEVQAEEFSTFVEQLNVAPRLQELYKNNWQNSQTSGVAPTAWRALNVVTEANDWLRGGRGNAESRFLSATDGQSARIRERASRLLLNR